MKPASWAILLAGGLLTLLIYGPRLNAPLIWDDRTDISFNTTYEHPIPLKDFFTPRYFVFSNEVSWRPLSTLSYYATIRIFGKSPAAFRSLSLLLHFLNGMLLFAILRAWKFRTETAAWAVALFWVHPAHIESLMCAAFNKEPLAAFGLLLMIAAHQRKRWGLAGLGFVIALLSKETGIAGLPLAILSDFCDGGMRRCRERLRPYCAYAAFLAIYVFVRFNYLAGPAMQVSVSLPFSERIYNALNGWITAVRVFFFPVALRIEYFSLPPESIQDWLVRGGIGMLLAGVFAALTYYLWVKNRKLAFFFLWPLPFLAITSNLIPASQLTTRMMAERWLYVPYLGCVVALAGLLPDRTARIYRFLAAALMAWWSFCGIARAQDWSQETRLWTSLERLYPWSAKAEEGLGEAYFRNHEYPQALAAFKRAEELRDSRADKILTYYVPFAHGVIGWENPSLYRWLGNCEVALGNMPKAAAYFEKALNLVPDDVITYSIMTYTYGTMGDYDRAKKWLERGLKQNPGNNLLLLLKTEIDQKKLSLHLSFD